MTGPDRGTNEDKQNGPNLAGKVTESTVFIDGIETIALLDTGSFYEKNLSHLPLLPVKDILKVECSDGQKLPYSGYIKASLTSPGISQCTEQFCISLVVPDTNYNLKVPLLIGTNILDEIEKDYTTQHGDQYLQRANLKTPWYLSLRCLAVRQRELKKNKNRIALYVVLRHQE